MAMEMTQILTAVTSILLAITGFLIVRWIQHVDALEKTFKSLSETVASLIATVKVFDANRLSQLRSCESMHRNIDNRIDQHEEQLKEHDRKITRLETIIKDD